MAEYLVLWLIVLVCLGIGILTNILFFRSSKQKKVMRRRNGAGLDAVLFGTGRRVW